MRASDVATSADTKATEARKASERVSNEETCASLTGRLPPRASQLGGLSIPQIHAASLSSPGFQSPGTVNYLLQLQRRYGNRHVQQVLNLARQAEENKPATSEVEEAIHRSRGGGRSLDSGVRTQMESAFEADFSSVRVHTNTQADSLNRALSARAFTTGQDIFFGNGEYNPGASSGRELLAHELTHVVQQHGSQLQRAQPQETGQALGVAPSLAPEAETTGGAEASALGADAPVAASDAPTVQCKPDPAAANAAPGECPVDVAPTAPAASGPTRDDPRSGVDWGAFWDEYKGNIGRTILEVGRVIPTLGAGAGFCADTIDMYQNTQAALDTLDPTLGMTTALHGAVVIANNLLGHLVYTGELAQDGVLISIVGFELTGVTVPLNATTLGIKSTLQLTQLLLDVFNATAATLNGRNPELTDQQREAYEGLARNFTVDAGLDLLGFIGDLIDLGTVGLANVQVAEEIGSGAKQSYNLARLFSDQFDRSVEGWVGIWGEETLPGGAVGGEIQRKEDESAGLPAAAAAPIILDELGVVQTAYDAGSLVIDFVGQNVDNLIAAMAEQAADLAGDKDPLVGLRDAIAGALHDVEERLGMLTTLMGQASAAEEHAGAILPQLDEIEANLQQIQLPEVDLAGHAELGDNPVADAVEGAVGAGAEVADQAAQAVVDKLQAAIDLAKEMAAQAIAELRGQIEGSLVFAQTFRAMCEEQFAYGTEIVGQLADNLAGCQNVEEVVDLVLGQVTEAASGPATTVDDLRKVWTDCLVRIQEVSAWAKSLR